MGYGHLSEVLPIKAFPVKRPALVQPVTRIEAIGGSLSVPQYVAPKPDDLLGHIIFALKYEGVNLAILAQALSCIDGKTLVAAITEPPSSAYLRKVCFLWEHFNRQQLDYADNPRGAAAVLFDPKRYVTGQNVRNNRWRVDFKRALEVELREETLFLQRFDALVKIVNENYDVRGNVLNTLVMQCLEQKGIVAKGRRKQYLGIVEPEVFDFLERHAQALLAEDFTEPSHE